MSCLLSVSHAWGTRDQASADQGVHTHGFLFAFTIYRTFVKFLERLSNNCMLESSYHHVEGRDSDTDGCINKGNKYQDALSHSNPVEQARQKEYRQR